MFAKYRMMTPLLPNLETRSDARLLRESRRHPEAFSVFYERHAEAVYAHARNRTGRQDVALELTAETFAQALRSARRYRESRGSAGSWLAGITNHLIASYVRKRTVEGRARRAYGVLEQTSFSETQDDVLERLDAGTHREALFEAIAGLPAEQRAAVELRVLEEASYGDIADRLGCSQGAARIRVHRGLARLRTQLGGLEWE